MPPVSESPQNERTLHFASTGLEFTRNKGEGGDRFCTGRFLTARCGDAQLLQQLRPSAPYAPAERPPRRQRRRQPAAAGTAEAGRGRAAPAEEEEEGEDVPAPPLLPPTGASHLLPASTAPVARAGGGGGSGGGGGGGVSVKGPIGDNLRIAHRRGVAHRTGARRAVVYRTAPSFRRRR